ncbi:MAG: hypothetical protein ACFFD2_17735 [Promethearchaeota archaeon]
MERKYILILFRFVISLLLMGTITYFTIAYCLGYGIFDATTVVD